MKKAKRPPKKLSFQELEAMNKDDIDHHLEPNSKAKYESGARRFAKFCENQGKDFYPSETNLCHFISVVSRELLPSTSGTRNESGNAPRLQEALYPPGHSGNHFTMSDVRTCAEVNGIL
ncbi:uncharacterized protein MELLADRAFT_104534 [Melampsora larici-populina 98AG31]|uniref:Uncharacterized protein n=1 Tax=Melampsora larici-populina (strain 98AG31 / pathotype 3-4-7) TaxID=747676 RepID=F4RF05_MELLP|nr:uncharacterized protein MELLADRAFT_104534 [Melampsora larici-populina 98AG31]EGG08734.1 hypothetical protein MELLADRAFT_104534 [Melampsora larici-populina 98AG31]